MNDKTPQTPQSQQTPQDRARKRAEEEPGAHSGAERQAGRRTVPGTASAAEGFRPDEGTQGGEPLKGVEADENDAHGQ
ncbi:hypothetical protein QWM81_09115 [Streptomyces ficellus]|uniref:Uncharacterized protein n=1 Tax=Streptomyces ficellus TaxID=1977088 RepID=A0ABT7Z405_9ACTN|nr:hypothetical protein [Streptomyces ficellus]MDN3294205.1 hypothetical protein [Streptomyces ficellus]